MRVFESLGWAPALQQPASGDHFVQTYRDEAFLLATVGEYAATGLRRGEAVILIATPEHRAAFLADLQQRGLDVGQAKAEAQLTLLDAAETLAQFTAGGMPDWQSFHATVGGVIAKLRLDYPAVRAYGEMVDLLWQRGGRDGALRLEEYWNDLAKLQTFSLLCAYRLDPLEPSSAHPLECLCKVHTHLIPAPDYARFNEAVTDAATEVLEAPLSQLLLSLAERHRPQTAMPSGQATLLWLQRNMPRTAEKVLAEVRQRCAS